MDLCLRWLLRGNPSKNLLPGIHHKIYIAFAQSPIYHSNIGGYLPPIISWP